MKNEQKVDAQNDLSANKIKSGLKQWSPPRMRLLTNSETETGKVVATIETLHTQGVTIYFDYQKSWS